MLLAGKPSKLPAIPFIEEMEKNLVDSEKRIEALSVKFDSEKEKAAEVIDGLQVELENAILGKRERWSNWEEGNWN